jgi:hypothetical protein
VKLRPCRRWVEVVPVKYAAVLMASGTGGFRAETLRVNAQRSGGDCVPGYRLSEGRLVFGRAQARDRGGLVPASRGERAGRAGSCGSYYLSRNWPQGSYLPLAPAH